jgi:serine/threonine protein kinase
LQHVVRLHSTAHSLSLSPQPQFDQPARLASGDHLSAVCWQVAREIQIHSGLVHDHIIALYGAFEDGKHVYLVQEFAPGALPYLHTNNRGLTSLPCSPLPPVGD